jgi:hypothetical protein
MVKLANTAIVEIVSRTKSFVKKGIINSNIYVMMHKNIMMIAKKKRFRPFEESGLSVLDASSFSLF